MLNWKCNAQGCVYTFRVVRYFIHIIMHRLHMKICIILYDTCTHIIYKQTCLRCICIIIPYTYYLLKRKLSVGFIHKLRTLSESHCAGVCRLCDRGMQRDNLMIYFKIYTNLINSTTPNEPASSVQYPI